MSVLALFGAIKNLLTPKQKGADIITSIFHLHRWTGVFLLGASILATSKQFFGDPIQCKPMYVPTNMFNTFCFMTGTFTVLRLPEDDDIDDVYKPLDAHRGVSALPDGHTVHHNYYQWVPFILFFQAVAFYLPYRIWKHLEGGKLEKLLAKVSHDPLTETPLVDQVAGVARFFCGHPGWYNSLARQLLLCEIGQLLNVILQMYILDTVLGHKFFSLGSDFLLVTAPFTHYHVLEDVFPLATKCRMPFIGSSGSPVNDSGMCILPINIVNQKIFLACWFLFILLLLLSSLKVIFNLLLILLPGLRYFLLRSQASGLATPVLSLVHRQCSFGDYTLLMFIARNLDGAQFETLLTQVSDRFTNRHAMSDDYPTLLIPPNDKQASNGGVSGSDASLDVRMRKSQETLPSYKYLKPVATF